MKKKLVEQLHLTFIELDADESGTLSLTEMIEAHPDVKDILNKVMNMHDIEDIFQCLDFDGSGHIEIEEFVQGLLEAQRGKSLEIHCLQRQCSHLVNSIRDLQTKVDNMSSQGDSCDVPPLPLVKTRAGQLRNGAALHKLLIM